MKKTLIVLLVLVFPMSLWAMDIPQGKYELTGTTSFDFSSSSADRDGGGDLDTDSITLNFDGQYYLQKNLALGAFFDYSDIDVDGGGDATSWMIGPQVTYNISIDPKLSFFVDGGVGYASYEWAGDDEDGFGIRIGGGLKYFIVNNIAVVGQLRYTWVDLDETEVDEFNLGIGLSVLF
ncbi:MAG: porin family protein [Deltaproteobacteria bacterium]|nr:porin family protein [Deltaproteobacteria bacterium]